MFGREKERKRHIKLKVVHLPWGSWCLCVQAATLTLSIVRCMGCLVSLEISGPAWYGSWIKQTLHSCLFSLLNRTSQDSPDSKESPSLPSVGNAVKSNPEEPGRVGGRAHTKLKSPGSLFGQAFRSSPWKLLGYSFLLVLRQLEIASWVGSKRNFQVIEIFPMIEQIIL